MLGKVIGLRKGMTIPFTPYELRSRAMEQALNQRFAALSPQPQGLWQIIQAALNP